MSGTRVIWQMAAAARTRWTDRWLERGGRVDEKERYLRWLELAWECYACGVDEERRKEEVLGVLRGLAQDSAEATAWGERPPWRLQW